MLLAIDDITLVVIGIAVMVFLFSSVLAAFVINQRKRMDYQQSLQQLRETQQNQLIEAAIRSEETERHRIAELLHDEVGAILSSSKLHLQGIRKALLDERDKKLFEQSELLLNDGIHKVRSISHNLHSNILKEFGLNEAILHFISKLTEGTMISTDVSLDSTYSISNSETDISIYRMLQELVNNILKHADAKEIRIKSQVHTSTLQICIAHNGDGLNQHQFEELSYRKEGMGLKNIKNRMILLKGTIEFHKAAGECSILINVPTK